MQLLPLFLDLTDRSCLVVGAGPVGRTRAASMLAAGAKVLLVDPTAPASLPDLAEHEDALTIEARPFREEDCRGRVLVHACTDREDVNQLVLDAARAHGALCCRADGGHGDFLSAVVLRRGDLCVAVSSAGASPRLATEARDRAATVIGEEFAEAARLLAGLRARLRRDGCSPDVRREVLSGSLAASLVEALADEGQSRAAQLVEEAYSKAVRAAKKASEGGEEGECTR